MYLWVIQYIFLQCESSENFKEMEVKQRSTSNVQSWYNGTRMNWTILKTRLSFIVLMRKPELSYFSVFMRLYEFCEVKIS